MVARSAVEVAELHLLGRSQKPPRPHRILHARCQCIPFTAQSPRRSIRWARWRISQLRSWQAHHPEGQAMCLPGRPCADHCRPRPQQGMRPWQERPLVAAARRVSLAWAAWILVAAMLDQAMQALVALGQAVLTQPPLFQGSRRRVLQGHLAACLQCWCRITTRLVIMHSPYPERQQ